jgi:hypothetical protein
VEPHLYGTEAATHALDEAIERHRAAPLALTLEARRLGPYRGYGEMLAQLRDLRQRGANLQVIGKSVRGEPLFALSVGPLDARRTTALLSGVHPTEWIGIETHFTLFERLLDRPPTDRRIVSIVIVNPDGVMQVESNLRRARRRFVRHNARRVDLNRNFPSFWNRRSLVRTLLRPIFANGTGPASEPEVRAITELFQGKMIDRAISFHSFGGVVLYPWAALLRAPMDAPELKRWARHVAELADPDKPYRAVQSSRWVPGITAPGLELDWFYDKHGALSLLVECSRGGLGLPRVRLGKLLEPFAWFNPPRPDRVAPNIARATESFARGAQNPDE